MLRSYRAVFDLEYRVYRLQRWTLPFPGGIALSTIAWTMGTAVAVLVADMVPGLGALLGLLPVPLRDLALPVGVGVLMSRYRPDGRPGHLFALAVMRFAAGPRHVDAFGRCAAPGRIERIIEPVALKPGAGDGGYRPGRLTGPAIVELRGPACVRQRGGQIDLIPAPGRPRILGRRLRLKAGQELVIHRDGARLPTGWVQPDTTGWVQPDTDPA